MKRFLIPVALLACLAGVTSAIAAKKTADTKADPVLMRVNGKDVTLSEFEYLYNKNNVQQQQPQTVDEYLDMFVDFKLKVADAEAAGIDTTASFINEYSNFRNDLAAPYLTDASVEDSLIRVAYDHLLKDVDVSHIMIQAGRTPDDQQLRRNLLDSLRTEIVAGRADWDKVAADYSFDRATSQKGGRMGWLSGGRTPYPFEDMAFNTPVGTISPVVNSGVGYHIIKVHGTRDALGTVHASHILKLTRGLSEEESAKAKFQIDSIYALLLDGANFAEMARLESQDGSSVRGGDLGWFGAGQMVQPFDSIAFALADGQMSEPFATPFGYHIILRHGHKNVEPLDSVRGMISRAISQDRRALMPHEARVMQLRKEYKASVDEKGLKNIRKALEKNPGGLDDAMRAVLASSNIKVGKFNGHDVTIADVMPKVPTGADITDVDLAYQVIKGSVDRYLNDTTEEQFRTDLAKTNADYRNLLNEYHDGILLFEISNRNVWERAVKDTLGLENFFYANRDKYKWDAPRYKGSIVFAQSDSLMNEAKKFVATLTDEQKAGTNLVDEMRARFGRDIKVERVIAPKGANAIVDYIGFGEERPADKGKWIYYFDVNGKIIDAPEEVIDVRGEVVTDYQTELGNLWLEELRQRYPVEIDQSVLDTIR